MPEVEFRRIGEFIVRVFVWLINSYFDVFSSDSGFFCLTSKVSVVCRSSNVSSAYLFASLRSSMYLSSVFPISASFAAASAELPDVYGQACKTMKFW